MTNTPHGSWPQLENMSWEEFERAMGAAFARQGYRVTQTKSGADGGVDLVLERPGERVLAQCKHWAAWKVNVKTVRELFGVMNYQGATGGIVATSGRFTQDASAFAREVGIRLLDRDDVLRMLRAAPAPSPGSTTAGASQAPRPTFTTPKANPRNPTRHIVGLVLLALAPVLVPVAALIGLALVAGMVVSGIPKTLPTVAGVPYVPPYVASTPSTDPRVLSSIQLPDKPNKVAVDQIGHRLYATGLEANSLKNVGTIAVGQRPTGIAIDASQHRAYIANSLDGSLTVVDTTSHKALPTVKLSYAMGSGAVDPVTHDVCFVIPSLMNIVYCYDAKWKLDGYATSSGESFAIDSVTHSSFGASPALSELRVADGVTKKRVSIPLHATPTGVAVDPSTHLVYVADRDDKAIQVVRPL